MLCVAALALLLPAPAGARGTVYARTYCVGLYCQIIAEPDQRRPPVRPATWRNGWSPKRVPKRPSRRSPELLRRAAAIARKQPWCDPLRVAECYDCACVREARQALRLIEKIRRPRGRRA
jgi:hypothetical protein